MTARTDITVDWYASPRIITVLAPSTEVSLQDLVDTARILENEHNAMDDDHLIDAGGKEDLGGGVKVGITATLRNALLAFEDRPGPTFEQCNISGGNLVALDSLGDTQSSPVYPSAYTQVVLANSSSATLQEQTLIQHSSYSGGVHLNSLSTNSGTEFPIGTPLTPVNNWTDAKAIAVGNGFIKYYVYGANILDNTVDIQDSIVVGQNANLTQLVIQDSANVTNVEFWTSYITGVLDGGCIIRESIVDGITYVNGVLFTCMLYTTPIVLGGSTVAHFLNCYSGIPGTGTPIIDFGGSGQGLSMRGYAGGIKLRNKSGNDSVSIDLVSGQVILEDTVTNGEIVVRGIGKVIDISGNHIHSGVWNGATIINETVSVNETAEQVWAYTGP